VVGFTMWTYQSLELKMVKVVSVSDGADVVYGCMGSLADGKASSG
jgi:hypothetical protein